jgi:hypothetical protein
MNLRTAVAATTNLIRGIGSAVKTEATKHVESELEGMAGRVAERVADNPKVIQAVERVGAAASKPISDAVQPKIILATVVAVTVIVLVVASVRRR